MATSYAIKVTPETIAYIVATAKERNRNLADYLFDSMDEANIYGLELYSIMSFNDISDDVTFTEVEMGEFRKNWYFVIPEDPYLYTIIERRK